MNLVKIYIPFRGGFKIKSTYKAIPISMMTVLMIRHKMAIIINLLTIGKSSFEYDLNKNIDIIDKTGVDIKQVNVIILIMTIGKIR